MNNGRRIRNMTVYVSPKDHFGNIFLKFPDQHFFYLGSIVSGLELPFASEAVNIDTFKIVFSVVKAPFSYHFAVILCNIC
jgi:hypothetical protein